MTMFIVIDARQSSCPEEYRELRRRADDPDQSSSSSDSDDDDDQWREDVCEQSIDLANRRGDSMSNRWMVKTFCPYYDEASELARENNDTLCQEKKRAIDIKRKRHDLKKKRDDDDDDQDKRQVLRKRELSKRLALRFLRKRLS